MQHLNLGEAHHGPVTAVVLRGDDVHAAIHGRVHTYDATTGTLQRTRTLLPCRVHGLACNDDGALLAWGVDAVGVARGDAVTTIATETRCVAAAFASSEDVATLTSAGAVERRDAATLARRGATAALQTSGELRCGALRVSDRVAACGGDAFGRIIVDGVGRDEAHGGVITSVAWAGDDVLSTSDDRRVTRWRINGDALEKVWTGAGHAARCWCAVAVGAYVVSGSQDGTAVVWSLSDGARVATLRGHAGKHVRCLGGSNGYVATGGHDGTARVWSLRDAIDSQTARRVRAPEATAPTAVCVLRDAVLACFASKRLWRLDLGTGEWRDLGVHGAARRLALDATEARVALIGGGGSSVTILDVASGASTEFSSGAAAAVSGWWVGPDLVVASVDRRCGAWRDGVCVATLAPVADNALGAVTAVASGGDGRWVVGDSRGRVALVEDGVLLWRADAHPKNAVLAVQFDGKMLHSFGRDGKRATFEVDESPHLASIQPLHVSVSGVCDDVAWGVVGAELVVLDVATHMRRATVAGTNRGRPHGVRVSGTSVRAVAAASDEEGGFLVVASETKCVTCGAPLVADGVEAVERARRQVALLQQARDGPVRPEGELRAAGAGRHRRQHRRHAFPLVRRSRPQQPPPRPDADAGGVHTAVLAILDRVLRAGGQEDGHCFARLRADHSWRLHPLPHSQQFRREKVARLVFACVYQGKQLHTYFTTLSQQKSSGLLRFRFSFRLGLGLGLRLRWRGRLRAREQRVAAPEELLRARVERGDVRHGRLGGRRRLGFCRAPARRPQPRKPRGVQRL